MPGLCDSSFLLAALNLGSLVHTLTSILLVAVGIGLVIFFHELGHFAVAKWCNVFVERFSIGFGPVLWSCKYGDTEYALSAIPFGGYVKMLGQDDMDPSQLTSEELAKDPQSYSSKSVGQRMAIISAGVIMNVVTAIGFYAIAFGHGIDMLPSIVGFLQPGFPAWQSGLQTGDRITEIGGRETKTFEDILRGIAFSTGPIEVRGTRADGASFRLEMTPNQSGGRRMIGLGPSPGLQVIKPREGTPPIVDPELPAATAQPAFEPGDQIVALNHHPVADFAALQRLLGQDRNKTVEFEVLRDKEGKTPVNISVRPQPFRRLGLMMEISKIDAIVKDSPAERNGMLVGDKILRVNNHSVGKDIDPLKLPDQLAALAGQEVTVEVQRDVKGADPKKVEIRLIPANKPGWVEIPRDADQPLSVPAIGVAYYVIPTVLDVTPKSPADLAGIKKGDRIKKAEVVLPAGFVSAAHGKTIVVDFSSPDPRNLKPLNWAYVVSLMQLAPNQNVTLTLTDGARIVTCIPAVVPQEDWYVPGLRGLNLTAETITLKSHGLLDAASMGFVHTRNSIIDLYLTLRNLVTGDLSVKNLHGPLGIASVAYGAAQQGWAEMSLFLAILSTNLAVLNFLPIPVLDGGHMVFLTWEAVTRKRPSERVQIAATYLGIAFVLCLALLVFYMDLFVHHVIL